jgi:hypothetical protein
VDATGRVTYAPNNLATYSQEPSNPAWNKTRASITADVMTAPDGTMTGDKLVEDTSTDTHRTSVAAISMTAGTAYTWSIFLKAGERTVAFVAMHPTTAGNAFTTRPSFYVNLLTGAITDVSASVTASSAVLVSGGWWRVSISAAATLTATNSPSVFLALPPNTGSYAGDGTSGLFIWGAQFEAVTYQTLPSTYVQTVASAYYGPRFDYDPVTLGPLGLLMEEQRSNLLFYSAEFDNAAWVKTGSTITANATTSPDGTVNAEKLVDNTSATTQHRVQQAVTTLSGVSYTYSVYLKAGERTTVRVRSVGTATFADCTVNLIAGTISVVTGTATITNAGGGWYRVSVIGAADSTTTTCYVNLMDAGSITYTGDGVSGAFLYGAQLEAGAFATSYIPTVASTVTRAVDIVTMTGTNFASWYNQSEGTIVSKFVATTTGINNGGGNDFPFVYEIDSAAVSDSKHQLILSGGYGPGWNAFTTVLGVNQANLGGAMPLGNSSVRKIAYAYRTDDFAVSANGGTVGTDPLGNLPFPDRIGIGCQNADGGNAFTGYMQALTFYPARLTNQQLRALSA